MVRPVSARSVCSVAALAMTSTVWVTSPVCSFKSTRGLLFASRTVPVFDFLLEARHFRRDIVCARRQIGK